ncbi:MAG: glycoside hydrolase family 140 protein [Candidatus Poribacteria bacterium]
MSNSLINISSNGRYFVDQDGMPFFWLGDTQWDLFRDFSIDDTSAILENRKNKGFTVIQVMFTGVGDGTKPNIEGQTPWINNDPAKPNESYFIRIDKIIELALKNGIIIVPGVFHQLQVSFITLENARNYAKWLANRYKDFLNIIWSMYPKAEKDFVPIVRELAYGLQDGDNGTHLISVHPDPAVASSSFIHSESWLSFNMIQTWLYCERIYEMVTYDYNLVPIKPTVMAEAGYEGAEFRGKVHSPHDIRKQAFWSYLAGGHHTYGNDKNYTSPSNWNDWIDSPGSFHIGTYKKIVTSCKKWWNWIPDQSIFADGVNSGLKLNVSARSANGDWIMAYLSSNTKVSIKMNKITVGNRVKAFWISPIDGVRFPIGEYENSGIQSFKMPENWDDAVLLLESV